MGFLYCRAIEAELEELQGFVFCVLEDLELAGALVAEGQDWSVLAGFRGWVRGGGRE